MMEHDPELVEAVVLAIQDACDNYIDGPTEAKAAITAVRAYDAATRALQLAVREGYLNERKA